MDRQGAHRPALLLQRPDLLLAHVPETEAGARRLDQSLRPAAGLRRRPLEPAGEGERREPRRRGVAVNVSSGWGHSTAPRVAPYCASKYAIEGLTGALAQELPEGLAAVPLSPGIIHTGMLDTAFGGQAAAHWKPEEWVEVAVPYLLRLGPADNGRSQRIPGS